MFITFVDTGRVDQEGNPLKDATLHVLAPIYANKSLQRKERMEDLAKRSFEVMKMTYEEVYQKPLKYTCEN